MLMRFLVQAKLLEERLVVLDSMALEEGKTVRLLSQPTTLFLCVQWHTCCPQSMLITFVCRGVSQFELQYLADLHAEVPFLSDLLAVPQKILDQKLQRFFEPTKARPSALLGDSDVKATKHG